MFKKRSKKGLSHVDWAMSLAIFLLYLAWFFIFVKPMFSPASSLDVLLDILDDGLEDNLFEETERIRVFISEGLDNENEPVVIPFTEDWSYSDITHTAEHFVIDEQKMFFLADLSNSSTFSIYYPHESLRVTGMMPVIADDDSAHYDTFHAGFDDYLLEDVYFEDDLRIISFDVEVDDTELDDVGYFENDTFLAKYKRATDDINLTQYLFAENSVIYTYMRSADFRNHSVQVDLTAFNYTYFYLDPSRNGEVDYSIGPGCVYYESDFLDLYDASSGLLITADRNITIALCANDTNPYVRLELDVEAGEEYNINYILHQGGVDSVLAYPIKPIVGVTETLSTVSAEKVSLMKNYDYAYMKQLFGFPKDRDFNITVSSDVVDATYGVEQPLVADIYARKVEGVIIDERFEPRRVLMTLTVW